MEPYACGELALHPHAFYALTAREFYLMWDGNRKRHNDLEETLGWLIAHLINGISTTRNHSVSIEDILGRPLKANLDAGRASLAEKDRKRREANERQ